MTIHRFAVLLVDDEQVVLDSLRLQIRRMVGQDVMIECAASVSEAWEVIEECEADGVTLSLVISDWLMPVQRGDAFLEEVKARHPGIRRVMLTGQADKEALQRIREQGLVDLLLHKPWSDRGLSEAMSLLVSR